VWGIPRRRSGKATADVAPERFHHFTPACAGLDRDLHGGVRVFLCWTICLLFAWPLRGDDLLPRVQRELKAQKFYFGEIDGRANDETVAAIEKLQVAKGIDKTGQLDYETLRALGMPTESAPNYELGRLLVECNACVFRYLQAWESGQWEQEAACFTEKVNDYDDQNVSRDFIREVRAKENRQWPRRKVTMLNRIASFEPGQNSQAQVTARVRTEAAGASGSPRVRTEDLVFRLEKTEQGWRIAALKLLE
jgi:hypothetical protein